MRDFATTAEPRGGSAPEISGDESRKLPFVIQKHAATRLHYDFRLGWRGVLKSWAVTKGPSYLVKDRRLAVQVEDHPMEYGGFEGTIPKGQYGGGTVMLWDEGTWEPVGDADEGLRTGRLKFILHGHKLQGHWTLVRMGGRAAQESKPNWLLIKEHDEFERGEDAQPITEEKPDSVITGRNLDAIAHAGDHVWDSRTGLAAQEREKEKVGKSASQKSASQENGSGQKHRKKVTAVRAPEGTQPEALPVFISPQLASQADRPPAGADWVHELKLDGYRVQARIENGTVALLTRKGLDWTHRMSQLAAALKAIPATALLDGEVVVLDSAGLSSFADLQAAFQEGQRSEMIYYVFDLLHLDGHSMRELPLAERKSKLAEMLASYDAAGNVRYSDHIEGRSEQMYDEACRLGAEGVISKEIDSRYVSGRSASWIKVKCSRQQEFVVGGFTLPSDGGDGLGALLLGYYRDGKLIYAGRAGTGFTQKTQRIVRAQVEELRQPEIPFSKVETAARKGALWVRPNLVAEIAFRTWTKDGVVRQASFKGLREDKPAAEVRREETAPVADVVEEAEREEIAADAPAPVEKVAASSNKKATRPHVTANLKMSHPDKVLDDASGLTKQMLADYYTAVAPRMMPHIADRPLSIVRCPDGTRSKCFFQKHVKVGLPKSVGSIDIVDKKGGPPEPYITLSTEEALVALSQMNVLELHPWGSTNADIERPDRLILDLDPDEALQWTTLTESAEEMRARLRKIGLTSFLKSTGGKGLHIVAPIEPEHDWATIKTFAHAFVQKMESENPKLYLTKMTKAARKDRIYLDYLRNERGATAVAPYSPRSRKDVPVSIPLAWSELKGTAAPRFLVARFDEWGERLKRDPWKNFATTRQSLTADAIASVSAVPRKVNSKAK